jgi:hypothetical protein
VSPSLELEVDTSSDIVTVSEVPAGIVCISAAGARGARSAFAGRSSVASLPELAEVAGVDSTSRLESDEAEGRVGLDGGVGLVFSGASTRRTGAGAGSGFVASLAVVVSVAGATARSEFGVA